MESTTASAQGPRPPAEELLKKIQEWEAGHAQLKKDMFKLTISDDHQSQRQRSHSISPQKPPCFKASGRFDGGALAVWKRWSTSFQSGSKGEGDSSNGGGPAAVKFTDRHYLNILQSMGQSVHIFDVNCCIIYWNRTAEQLCGYSAEEALGQNPIVLLTAAQDYADASNVVIQSKRGEIWTGHFPVKNKQGDKFLVVATTTPFYDDDGTFVGVICTSTDAEPFQ